MKKALSLFVIAVLLSVTCSKEIPFSPGERTMASMHHNYSLLVLLLLFCLPVRAQTMTDDFQSMVEGYKYAFSKEGRMEWRPEFTIRTYGGLVTGGQAVTGGLRINQSLTLGLMAWSGKSYIDAVPAHIFNVSAGVYMRNYLHLGKRDIFAFYSDLAMGAEYIYRVDGKYWNRDGEQIEMVKASPGDWRFAATWQPGIRIRFLKSLHLFLGPTLSTNTIGAHLGLGFSL